MLRQLHVKHLALIEECDLEIHGGMTAVTGESGAGKSLLMDSLGLMAGKRATPSLVRSGTDRATVEAVFEVAAGHPVQQMLAELGLESDGDGEVILRREVMASGRSRAAINGRLVPVAQLESVAALLIDLGGQHDQLALLEPTRQQELFDEFAAAGPLLTAFREAWLRAGAARRDLEALRSAARDREQRLDFLRFQLQELESANLSAGEMDSLEQEHSRLANRDALLRLGQEAQGHLSEGGDSGLSALDMVGRAMAALEDAARMDPALASVAEEVASAHAVLSDASWSLGRYLGSTDADPARLEEIAERREQLKRLLRKHGPSEQDALARLAEMRTELDKLDSWEEQIALHEKALSAAVKVVAERAAELRNAREKAAPGFAKPVTAILRDFSMPKARFEVALSPISSGLQLPDGRWCAASGTEEVEFLFSANNGNDPVPLRRAASGGELSRLMLALRTMSVTGSNAPLLVFDEVDSGISGTAARRVAERLAALAERCQILCVTHNPSVAAAGRQHLLVEKHSVKDKTTTHVRLLDGVGRQGELARLLDGGKNSEKGLALAADLLGETA